MLLETLVAISLIGVVMAGFTTFFINSVAFTSLQRATQIATQVGNSTVEAIRALPASDPVNGHDVSSVTAQFNAGLAAPAVAPWLDGMVQATDPLATTPGSGLTAVVPTAAVIQTVNNVAYSVNSYFGTCVIPTGTTLNASCALGAVSTGIGYLRAVVAVTWAGARCPPAGCTYVTSTLLSTVDDPLFNPNQSAPAVPVLNAIPTQISAVGDIVSVLPTFTAVPSTRFAITSGSLPAGLILNTATGLINGTASAVTPSTPLILTLTDGFGRTTTASFTWTVVAALTTTAPPNQASLIGTALALTVPAASGGTPGYTWTDPGATLPPGLTVATVNNQASITGTPTTRGVFAVTLTVADSTTTRKSTVSFSWTTDYPPFAVTNPGPQTSTVNTADTVTMGVTGGSGSFAWTGTVPPGLTLNPLTGLISGSPTTVGVTSVALVVTDSKAALVANVNPKNVAFNFTVYAKPTVTAPAPVIRDVGGSVSVQLTTTCPNAPCAYLLNNGPATLGINSSGLITGTVTAAQTFNSATVTVTDSSGATGTSASFQVTVNAAPSISNPGNQTVAPGVAVSFDVAALTTGGTAPLVYSAVNLPSWLTLNTATGLITGTAPGTAASTSGIVLTVRDSLNVSASSAAFSWIVGGAPSAPLSVVVVNGDGRVTPSWTAPTTGPVTSYTATLSPGGLSCTTSGLSCAITGLTNGVVYSVTVKATNTYGVGPTSTAVIAIPYPAVMSAANGMTLWLDGADPSVLLTSPVCAAGATTTAIGCWKDKSGQATANNFTQATVASRPSVSTWNGLGAVNFPDTGDVLTSVNSNALYQTAFIAANVKNPAGAGIIVNLLGAAGIDYNVQIGSGAARNTPNSQDWSNGTGTPPLNWANGAQGANPSQPLTVITTDQGAVANSGTASVSNSFANRGLVGQLGDVITFNDVLSTAERRSVEEYLARKWGVWITPQAPTAVTGVVASTTSATISWAAPSFNGGAAISGYTVTASPGGRSCTTTGALTCAVTGLTHNTTYTFTATATNSAGVGPVSTASGGVRP